MQYFSLISRSDRGTPRICAMLRAPTLEDAARKAASLLSSHFLQHIDTRAEFSIRQSSRRETNLLQAFLASATGDQLRTYGGPEFDGLLSRRSSLLLSFFIAMYLDPVALKNRYAPSTPAHATPRPDDPNSGSGTAVEIPVPVSLPEQETIESNEVDPSQSDAADEPLSPAGAVNALEDIMSPGANVEDLSFDLD